MGGIFLAILLAPVLAATFGYLFVRPRTSGQGLGAVAASVGLLVTGAWFGLRFDESNVEAVVSAVLCILCFGALAVLRKRAGAAPHSVGER